MGFSVDVAAQADTAAKRRSGEGEGRKANASADTGGAFQGCGFPILPALRPEGGGGAGGGGGEVQAAAPAGARPGAAAAGPAAAGARPAAGPAAAGARPAAGPAAAGAGGGAGAQAAPARPVQGRLEGVVGQLEPSGASMTPCDCGACRMMADLGPMDSHTVSTGPGHGTWTGDYGGPGGERFTVVPHIQMRTMDSGGDPPIPGRAFGICYYMLAMTDVNWTANDSQVELNATLVVNMPRATRAADQFSIENADSPFITADNWRDVVADLTPRPEHGGNSLRRTWWSHPITVQHEDFHAQDNEQWTRSTGLPRLVSGLSAPMTGPSAFFADDILSRFNTRIRAAILTQLRNVCDENVEYMGRGPHDQNPGEMRAYEDGRAAYEALVAGIRARFAPAAEPEAEAPAARGAGRRRGSRR